MLNRLADFIWDYLGLIMCVAWLALGFAGGWYGNGLRWEAKYNGLEKTHAEAATAQATAIIEAVEKVREMEKQGDEIAARLIAAETARQKLAKERDDALKTLTTGRACLDGTVVRLLNDPTDASAGIRLSATSSDSLAANRAFATDTDVAIWAANARDEHDSCRARIDALKSFYDGVPK